jgi:hypothetical protein
MPIVSLVMTTALGACAEWVAGPPPPPTPITTVVASRARIEMIDGRAYQVMRLTVTGDSLFGDNVVTHGERVAVATRDVTVIRTRQFTQRRGWIVAGLVLLVLIATGTITLTN